MDISASQELKDRISELPDDILVECLSLLEMKTAAQTSILSKRWRYLWTYLTRLDFDAAVMYPEEYASFWKTHEYQTSRYFAWINQVVSMHRGPCIDKFRVHTRYVLSYATQLDEWVQFAFSKRVKELVLDLIGINLVCAERSKKGYPLGFDMLRYPPCFLGISALQSLHLCYVNVSEEFVEFLLSHCLHLERLYLHSVPLSKLTVKTSKLKYFSIIMRFHDLQELEIDAENLLYFEYDDGKREGGPCMVFKNLPMLIETHFGCGFCWYPFPIFDKLSQFSKQLCKLSLELNGTIFPMDLVIPDGAVPTFPNVKHFTCTIGGYHNSCILSMKCFIDACPMLEEFKLQICFLDKFQGFEEASELQEINLENEKENEETNSSELGLVDDEEKPSHPNLRIMELVGFLGTRCDVQLALAVVSYASSLETIICDPEGKRFTHSDTSFWTDFSEEFEVAKRRARKLAKIVAPKVNVVIT